MKKTFIVIAGLVVIMLVIIITLLNKSNNSMPSVDFNGPAPEVEHKGIVFENIFPNRGIRSPYQIIGYVNGNGWIGFEGQVGTVTLYDNTNQVLATSPLTATSDWMTTTVQFAANLVYTTSAPTGTLVFKNENPSGEPIRDRTVSVPVAF